MERKKKNRIISFFARHIVFHLWVEIHHCRDGSDDAFSLRHEVACAQLG